MAQEEVDGYACSSLFQIESNAVVDDTSSGPSDFKVGHTATGNLPVLVAAGEF